MRTLLTSIILITLIVSCNTVNTPNTSKEPIAKVASESQVFETYCKEYLNKLPSQVTEEEYNYYLDVFCETDEWFDIYDRLSYYEY